MTHDLILKGGRVLDPGEGIDRVADVAISVVRGAYEDRAPADAAGV